ncbi:hypothetical protein WICPIJ_004467 [Wickerhamomyces pijperi]|uniref:Matrin-type domain-containing protein n=1 Tax=Wickerhamomyces pijperi TaxID=599730 RepID=A0A9P8Q5Y0_WICPI|nr:hypothetical protein WICPIJ_004467 [Wickerhamomyces pijperi]
MVRFYCDYCKSYLTHDAASVRKNHLTGKNHIKLVCDYYEEKAKESGIWETKIEPPSDISPFQITIDKLYRGIPGSFSIPSGSSSSTTNNSKVQKDVDYYKLAETKRLPPPPHLSSFPNPPKRILYESKEHNKELIGDILRTVT